LAIVTEVWIAVFAKIHLHLGHPLRGVVARMADRAAAAAGIVANSHTEAAISAGAVVVPGIHLPK
jgi:hypothetical protein